MPHGKKYLAGSLPLHSPKYKVASRYHKRKYGDGNERIIIIVVNPYLILLNNQNTPKAKSFIKIIGKK